MKRKKIVMIGTGARGQSMFGNPVVERYSDRVEYVALCDTNRGRVETVREMMGVNCPVYTDFEQMMSETKPDMVVVSTIDSLHDHYIIRALQLGADVISEKPMTTDEIKCEAILQAEKQYGKKVTVTFNCRYSPHRQKIWELLREGVIGQVTSADLHWYLDTNHGSDYFRRWHAYKEFGGSLWVHKATHHFDLMGYWLDSEPEEVFALGDLVVYGRNGLFRGKNCRNCAHTGDCRFFWDMTQNKRYMELYAKNESLDGYYRDGCVYRSDIDIYDRMTATIKYANGTNVSYSLSAFSPYEGYRIAFNGTNGRLEAWIEESNPMRKTEFYEIMVTLNDGQREIHRVSKQAGEGGHNGGDYLLLDSIFLDKRDDPYKQQAGVRDGTFSILTGIAARNSCESGKPIRIASLTSLVPKAKKE